MMRRNRAWLVVVSAFVLAVFLGVAAVDAASQAGKISMSRAGRSASAPGAQQQFNFATQSAGGCYGGCNCNVCVCYYYDGDLGCCFDGCDACWGSLDDGGYCGAMQ